MTHKQLRQKLKKYGISQEEAAKACGVTQPHFSLFINGIRKSVSLHSKLEAFLTSLEEQLKKHSKGDL
jgi:transcriptional regulator with XRE-family HTH domain